VQRNVRCGFAKARRLVGLAQDRELIATRPEGGRYRVLYDPADTDQVIARLQDEAAEETTDARP
jgi:hypothetical protein